jgi:hypothetical protein
MRVPQNLYRSNIRSLQSCHAGKVVVIIWDLTGYFGRDARAIMGGHSKKMGNSRTGQSKMGKERTYDQLISTTGYESPWSTNGDTDRLPGISGGDTGFRIGNRPGFGRRGRPPAVLGPQTRAGKSQVAMSFM